MNEKMRVRQLNPAEAFAELALTSSKEGTYTLPGMILRVLGAELKVTLQTTGTFIQPDVTTVVGAPVEYIKDGKKFLLRADEGNLIVEEVVADNSGGR